MLSFGDTSTLPTWKDDRRKELRELLELSGRLNTSLLQPNDVAEVRLFGLSTHFV